MSPVEFREQLARCLPAGAAVQFVSGYATDVCDAVPACVRDGDAFLAKPFTPLQLVSSILRMLANRK